MNQWTVRAINAHDGSHAWEQQNITATTANEALSDFLDSWIPNRPLTILVWIIDEHNKDCELRTIGLN